MKKLLITLSLILITQILSSQMNYEFSTWIKTTPIGEYNINMQLGRIASTRIQLQTPWKITIIAISATTMEALGDALYDQGKNFNPKEDNFNSTQRIMMGKAFQAASLGTHFLYIPVMKNSNTSWLWVPVVEAFWRFIIFDAAYNLFRGLPIGYIGTTSYWDKGMQAFSPPAGMRLFANGIAATFIITLTFDKF